MSKFETLIIASLCALAAATPARAVDELPDCDAIKDTANRIACLQAHIAHLEQTLLSLNSQFVDLKHDLKAKLAADEVYKLQYVGKGTCLGFTDNDKPPMFGSCDRPDSWKLVRGTQTPGKESAAPKTQSPDQPDKSADKGKGKNKNKDKQKDNPQDQSTDEPKTLPQPQPN